MKCSSGGLFFQFEPGAAPDRRNLQISLIIRLTYNHQKPGPIFSTRNRALHFEGVDIVFSAEGGADSSYTGDAKSGL